MKKDPQPRSSCFASAPRNHYLRKLDITLDAVHGLYITDNACPRQQLRGLGASYQHTFGLVGQDMLIEKRSCVNCRPSC